MNLHPVNTGIQRVTAVDIAVACKTSPKTVLNHWSTLPNWPVGQKEGQAGRLVWLINALPERIVLKGRGVRVKQRVFNYLTQKMAGAVAQEAAAAHGAGDKAPSPVLAGQQALFTNSRQQLKEACRMGVLKAVERIQFSQQGLSRNQAARLLLQQAREGNLNSLIHKQLLESLDGRGLSRADGLPSEGAIATWFKRRDEGTLAPIKSQDKDLSVQWWCKSFLQHYQQPTKPAKAEAYREFCKEQEQLMAEQGVAWPLPSRWAVDRWLKKLGAVTLNTGRMGARELKALQPYVKRTFEDLLPNDVWSADGHCFDAEIQHPITGRPFRPEITAIVDIATRRLVGWSVDLAESGLAVLDAIRCGVEIAGVPAIFYVDNGSGYKNAMMKDEALGLMGRLGVSMEHSVAYNSQARGVIERLHKTVFVTAAKNLTNYIGRDMDREARLNNFKITRRAIKQGGRIGLMAFADFVNYLNEVINAYNHQPHKSLGDRSPNEAWEAFEQGGWEAIKEDNPETLNQLFRPRVARKVARCWIAFANHDYFSQTLIDLHGEPVQVAYDIHDASRIWVYLLDGTFVCTAQHNGNAAPYFATPVVEQKRKQRGDARLKRLDEKRQAILEERNGGLITAESAPDFSQILQGDFERLDEEEPIFLFESEREEWLAQQAKKINAG